MHQKKNRRRNCSHFNKNSTIVKRSIIHHSNSRKGIRKKNLQLTNVLLNQRAQIPQSNITNYQSKIPTIKATLTERISTIKQKQRNCFRFSVLNIRKNNKEQRKKPHRASALPADEAEEEGGVS